MCIPKYIVCVLAVGFLCVPNDSYAATHWVSPTGTSLWAACASETDPGENYCSLDTANNNVSPGDTVYLKGGTYTLSGGNNYDQGIAPQTSGTLVGTNCTAKIIYQNASGETPIISSLSHRGIYLVSVSCIKITGITFQDIKYYANFISATHNEISYNTFTATSTEGTVGFGIHLDSRCGETYDCWNTHNWIHHNTIEKKWSGTPCGESADLIRIGDDASGETLVEANDYNTVENNIIAYASHTPMDTHGNYTVVRNNHFHNEPWREQDDENCTYKNEGFDVEAFDGKYGHRTFQITDGYNREKMYSLIEGNRSGFGSANPGNNGADGMDIAGPGNIVRYNYIFSAMNSCLMFKYGWGGGSGNGGSYNKAYNNTLYRCGYGFGTYYEYDQPGQATSPEPLLAVRFYQEESKNNVVKNNLIYDSRRYAISGFEIGRGGANTAVGDNSTIEHNWLTSNGDPKFVNPDLADPTSATLPNLTLQSSSGAIDGNTTSLTLANGAGDNNATLHVDDAMYFQDGTWGSDLARGVTLFPDWIAIGTVTNVVQISSIDYATNTITLASPMTWDDDAPIWLYKKSDGERVLYGSAPDYGAYEYDPGAAPQVTGSFGGNLR